MWLYIGIRAEFINSALWRRSVRGVVASILLFIRLASVFLIVSSIVLCSLDLVRTYFTVLNFRGKLIFKLRCLS